MVTFIFQQMYFRVTSSKLHTLLKWQEVTPEDNSLDGAGEGSGASDGPVVSEGPAAWASTWIPWHILLMCHRTCVCAA